MLSFLSTAMVNRISWVALENWLRSWAAAFRILPAEDRKDQVVSIRTRCASGTVWEAGIGASRFLSASSGCRSGAVAELFSRT